MDYPAAAANPFGLIRTQIIAGFGGGAWAGPGIISSFANAATHGVGYAENSVLGYPAFQGQPVDATSVLFAYTRYGDADLNGLVNLNDFNRLATNFGLVGAVWTDGDFDYNGTVGLGDYNLMAANFGLAAAPDGPTPEDWTQLAAAVPEPLSASVLTAAFLGMLISRHRRG